MKLQFIEAGEIVTTHGVRGEVKVLCWLDDPEMLCEFDRCRISGKEYTMTEVRVQKTCNLVKLQGIDTMEAAQAFVEEHNIRFSLAFGPVLVDNGVRCEPYGLYPCGEIEDPYARAGLGQIGELHYLVVTCNRWQVNNRTATIHDFAQVMLEKKCWKAYTLDGGQTGVIALDGKMMNPAQYGSQRLISDIFYFATALPDGE